MFGAYFKKRASPVIALGLVIVLGALTAQSRVSPNEARALAASFGLSAHPLPVLAGYTIKSQREVHPSLARISAWISAFGASVALADLDGDGLPNDLCTIDPRIDQVMIAPAPGTGERYTPFALELPSSTHDPVTIAPTGCLPADLNEDGRIDVLVHFWGRTPVMFLRRASTTPTAAPPAALTSADYFAAELTDTSERWFTNSATTADFDGDGHLDLLIANYYPEGADLLNPKGTTAQRVQDSNSSSFSGGEKHFFLFKEAASGTIPYVRYQHETPLNADPEVARGWTLAVGAADLDGDLLPEIYLANDFGPDRLLHNRSTPHQLRFISVTGKRGFFTPKSFVLGKDSFKGMGVDFGDLNGDGHLDIYISNIANPYGLLESHMLWLHTGEIEQLKLGNAPFIQASERLGLSRSGWGWGARLADFNNDGVLEAVQATGFIKGRINRWPEMQAVATSNERIMSNPQIWPSLKAGDDVSGHQPNAFFVRAADGHYYNLAKEIGWDQPMVSRGIAIADVDGDGALDLAISNQWETSYFYHNDCPDCPPFLGLHLLLSTDLSSGDLLSQSGHPDPHTAHSPAIGASVVVSTPDHAKQVGQVDGGSGHSGKRAPDLHFGLGSKADESTILKVRIRWRDRFGAVHAGQIRLSPGWHTVYLGAGRG